jgi:hypothetical protein
MPLCVLNRLNNSIAVVFNLLNIPSTLFYKLKDPKNLANLKLLYVCQGRRCLFIISEPVYNLDKIVLLRKTKVNSLTVLVNKL